MNLKRKPSLVQFLAGASVAAMGASAPLAMAQDATAGDETSDEISQDEGDVIIVSGIRASLQDAMNIAIFCVHLYRMNTCFMQLQQFFISSGFRPRFLFRRIPCCRQCRHRFRWTLGSARAVDYR